MILFSYFKLQLDAKNVIEYNTIPLQIYTTILANILLDRLVF